MKDFLKNYFKKVIVGTVLGIFGIFTIGMSHEPQMDIKAAPSLSTEVCNEYSESVKLCMINTQLSINFDLLTDSSLSQIESMIPDEAKCLASRELCSASRREYIQWFYNHGYIPAELLGIASVN